MAIANLSFDLQIKTCDKTTWFAIEHQQLPLEDRCKVYSRRGQEVKITLMVSMVFLSSTYFFSIHMQIFINNLTFVMQSTTKTAVSDCMGLFGTNFQPNEVSKHGVQSI